MPTRKMRVEVFDGEGNRYTVSFEGQVTRDKAARLLDLMELLGGTPAEASNSNMSTTGVENTSSKYEKVGLIVSRRFPLVWFTSKEVQSAYEQEYGEPINLSTVATYLARMVDRTVILKAGASNSLKYKLARDAPQATMKQHLP